jgi:hypothetical protein
MNGNHWQMQVAFFAPNKAILHSHVTFIDLVQFPVSSFQLQMLPFWVFLTSLV